MSPSTQPSRRFDAVICDVDGCLQPERAGDPVDAAALLRVREHNQRAHEVGDVPVVTLCTGRPQPYAEAIARIIDVRTLPIVCEMGVWLWHPSDNRFDMDPSITPDDLAAIQAARSWIASAYGPGGVVMQPGKTASISLFHPDTAYLKSLEPALRRRFEQEGWPMRVSSTWLWINIDLEQVSKKTGIKRLFEATGPTNGLSADRCCGIGDTMGDLAIRESVAWFACPSNAEPGLQDVADLVSTMPEIAGVLDILKQLPG